MENFKIIPSPQYKKCREKLAKHYKSDLDVMLNNLEKKPCPPIAKPLREKLEGKYSVRFANQSHRLVIQINWDARSIILLYLAPRSHAYNGKMWQ